MKKTVKGWLEITTRGENMFGAFKVVRIFQDKQHEWASYVQCVPCTITYSIPTKSKKKGGGK